MCVSEDLGEEDVDGSELGERERERREGGGQYVSGLTASPKSKRGKIRREHLEREKREKWGERGKRIHDVA